MNKPKKKKQKKQEWPESYLKTFSAFVDDDRSIEYASALIEHSLEAAEGKQILMADVCCGAGEFGDTLKETVPQLQDSLLTFVDASDEILNSIERESDELQICTNVTNMPELQSDRYDLVVCRYGFNNLPREQWRSALDEVLRILVPGGVFILQDHFVPGLTFAALVNDAEQFLARMEGKSNSPFIYSTGAFNALLDEHPLVVSRVKAGYSLSVNVWERLKAKKHLLPDYEKAKAEILRFYSEVCLEKFQVLIVNPEESIPVYNVTYAIKKRG